MTVKNKYLLPLISELVSQLHGARYFTKLDVCWGFNNICIKPGDEWKAAFLSQKVTYLFCDELDIVSKELRSRVRQATKDVVKSEV